MRCPGGVNQLPKTMGSGEGVSVQITSPASTASHGVDAAMTLTCTCATARRNASTVSVVRDHTAMVPMGSTDAIARSETGPAGWYASGVRKGIEPTGKEEESGSPKSHWRGDDM